MRNIIPALLVICFLVGCSDGLLDFETQELEGMVGSKQLRVVNKLDRSIFYFAVECETAALVDWIPVSTEENQIKSREGKNIPLEDILGYERGKEILFYYWPANGTGTPDIKNIVIETD